MLFSEVDMIIRGCESVHRLSRFWKKKRE